MRAHKLFIKRFFVVANGKRSRLHRLTEEYSHISHAIRTYRLIIIRGPIIILEHIDVENRWRESSGMRIKAIYSIPNELFDGFRPTECNNNNSPKSKYSEKNMHLSSQDFFHSLKTQTILPS